MKTLNERFTKERDLVLKLREIRTKLEERGHIRRGERETQRERIGHADGRTESALQGENPLMRVCVDGQTISEVISAWTGIPAGKMLKDEIATVLTLEGALGGARDRAEPRAGADRRAHSHLEGESGRSAANRSGFSCWWGPAASARRRRR